MAEFIVSLNEHIYGVQGPHGLRKVKYLNILLG